MSGVMTNLLQGLRAPRAPTPCWAGILCAEGEDVTVRSSDQQGRQILKHVALISCVLSVERPSAEHKQGEVEVGRAGTHPLDRGK